MIWATIFATSILGQKSLWPADARYQSRVEFYALASKIKDKMTRDDVIRILGRPDRIRKRKGDLLGEVFEYGIDQKSDAPTLGIFTFRCGKFSFGSTWRANSDFLDTDKPYQQLVPELELRSILGNLDRETPEWLGRDPLRKIRFANLFIKLGDEKAKFILGEFERLGNFWVSDPWYKDLLGLLFDSQSFIENLPFWIPREPIFLVSTGSGPSIRRYSDKPIRSKPIRPPNDPFDAVKTALKENHLSLDSDDPSAYLEELLMLVRGVIKPVDFRTLDYIRHDAGEKYHELFLRQSPTWDADSQSYMRTDGTILPDWPIPPIIRWNLPDLPKGTDGEIYMSRVGDTENVEITLDLAALAGKKLPDMKIRAINIKNNSTIGIWKSNNLSITGSGRLSSDASESSPEGHEATNTFMLEVPIWSQIQLEVITSSGTTRSQVFRL